MVSCNKIGMLLYSLFLQFLHEMYFVTVLRSAGIQMCALLKCAVNCVAKHNLWQLL